MSGSEYVTYRVFLGTICTLIAINVTFVITALQISNTNSKAEINAALEVREQRIQNVEQSVQLLNKVNMLRRREEDAKNK